MYLTVLNSKASAKVKKIMESKSIELEFSGDFVGTEEYTFEPIDEKTKVQVRRLASCVRPPAASFTVLRDWLAPT